VRPEEVNPDSPDDFSQSMHSRDDSPRHPDVYVLPAERIREVMTARESVRTGARYLRELCSGGGAGLREFSALLGSSVGERRARASLEALVDEFTKMVESMSAEA
jgi:hypothetical protein